MSAPFVVHVNCDEVEESVVLARLVWVKIAAGTEWNKLI